MAEGLRDPGRRPWLGTIGVDERQLTGQSDDVRKRPGESVDVRKRSGVEVFSGWRPPGPAVDLALTRSRGREPYRRMRLYPDVARPSWR